MATFEEVRLVPVNTRDGVDTRKKDNSGKTAVGTEETTSMEAVHVRGGQCAVCGDEECMRDADICADCYWDEDADIKRWRRVDIEAIARESVDVSEMKEWEDFWVSFRKLSIRIPEPKTPCACGAEGVEFVRGALRCEACADFAQNVGRCEGCGIYGPRPKRRDMCYECVFHGL